jgi:hypothetical protein
MINNFGAARIPSTRIQVGLTGGTRQYRRTETARSKYPSGASMPVA